MLASLERRRLNAAADGASTRQRQRNYTILVANPAARYSPPHTGDDANLTSLDPDLIKHNVGCTGTSLIPGGPSSEPTGPKESSDILVPTGHQLF